MRDINRVVVRKLILLWDATMAITQGGYLPRTVDPNMWLVFLGEQKWDTLTPFRIGKDSVDMADVRR